jgi:hypothetical protein
MALPTEARSLKSGQRMAAKKMQFPWRWNVDTISTNLDVHLGDVDSLLGRQSAQLPDFLR